MTASQARYFEFERNTSETSVKIALNIDGSGKTEIDTGFGMFNHMLNLLAFWADFDLMLQCRGDLDVDAHHTIEDVGLCLGSSLLQALGSKKGIFRAGFARVPMDEALTDVSIDLSGRPWLEWHENNLLPPVIAHEEKDIWREFYKAFSSSGKFNLHISFLYGKNGHHLLESVAKSCGLAMKQAVRLDGSILRSTKGKLD